MPEAVQWRVMQTMRIKERNLFQEFPELREGLQEGELPPVVMPEENPRRRGPQPTFTPRMDTRGKRTGVGSRLFEY